MNERTRPERGPRVNVLTMMRYLYFKASHGWREPWGDLARRTEHYAEVGSATRCRVCGLSIRGPLGFVNRAVWGVAPLPKHPDLCNV